VLLQVGAEAQNNNKPLAYPSTTRGLAGLPSSPWLSPYRLLRLLSQNIVTVASTPKTAAIADTISVQFGPVSKTL